MKHVPSKHCIFLLCAAPISFASTLSFLYPDFQCSGSGDGGVQVAVQEIVTQNDVLSFVDHAANPVKPNSLKMLFEVFVILVA